jgi:hypothetical protein
MASPSGLTPRRPLALLLALALLLLTTAAAASSSPSTSPPTFVNHLGRRADQADEGAFRGPPAKDGLRIPMKITNNCNTKIWPAVFTQHGVGPGVGGFELRPHESANLFVGPTWQGRIWGRTNCTVNGESASCSTGDCWHMLDCPATVR